MTGRTVVLRDIHEARDTRRLVASLTASSDLVIEGQDLGDAVERVFGAREYEWVWTIHAADVGALLDALGVPSDVLSALHERFCGDRAAEVKPFLDAHGVPHEVWSRVGD